MTDLMGGDNSLILRVLVRRDIDEPRCPFQKPQHTAVNDAARFVMLHFQVVDLQGGSNQVFRAAVPLCFRKGLLMEFPRLAANVDPGVHA